MTFSGATAVVLGPGGLVGTAWLLGLAAGLRADGVDLAEAGLVVGTSAGAIAGAVLATGGDLDRLATLPGPQRRPDSRLMAEVFTTLGDSGLDPAEARRRVGRIALTAPTVPEQVHVADVRSLTGTGDWPGRPMLITAVDVETGRPVVWDRTSGVALPVAVAASCAMPGAYPPVTVDGRRYMDGALGGGSHTHLAAGVATVVVIEPLAHRFGAAAAPAGATTVVRIAPDEAAQNAFGPDPGDPTRWQPAYQAGVSQAGEAAGRLHLTT
ncbi:MULTISPECIES: patatin-like phospholipase family protein [Frankia]|nr:MULTISPECIES: patatin-like phospholipase family protein [Frankia]KQC36321.1 patatin [Frankia sp. ACN1ag]